MKLVYIKFMRSKGASPNLPADPEFKIGYWYSRIVLPGYVDWTIKVSTCLLWLAGKDRIEPTPTRQCSAGSTTSQGLEKVYF